MIKQIYSASARAWRPKEAIDGPPLEPLHACRPVDDWGREYRAVCLLCGKESLVIRCKSTNLAIGCEQGCLFEKITAKVTMCEGEEGSLVPADMTKVVAYQDLRSSVFRVGGCEPEKACLYIRRSCWNGRLANWDSSVRRKAVEEPIERAGYEPTFAVPPGFLQVLQHQLEKHNVTLQLHLAQDWRWERPAGATEQLLAKSPMVSFVASTFRGVIEVDGFSSDPAKLISQVALAWPNRRLVIICRTAA